jgi:hypothetical protein
MIGMKGWSAINAALDSLNSLSCLNRYREYDELRNGSKESFSLSFVSKEAEPGAALVPLLLRSASQLTFLDLRYHLVLLNSCQCLVHFSVHTASQQRHTHDCIS